MFAEMPGTSSQNTWTVGLILYFLSNYLSSCRSKEIQKTDKCQACACLLEVPRCAWKEVTSTLQLPLPLLVTSQSIFMFFSKATNWPLSTTQIFFRLKINERLCTLPWWRVHTTRGKRDISNLIYFKILNCKVITFLTKELAELINAYTLNINLYSPSSCFPQPALDSPAHAELRYSACVLRRCPAPSPAFWSLPCLSGPAIASSHQPHPRLLSVR